jgi:hypothetical protein
VNERLEELGTSNRQGPPTTRMGIRSHISKNFPRGGVKSNTLYAYPCCISYHAEFILDKYLEKCTQHHKTILFSGSVFQAIVFVIIVNQMDFHRSPIAIDRMLRPYPVITTPMEVQLCEHEFAVLCSRSVDIGLEVITEPNLNYKRINVIFRNDIAGRYLCGRYSR